MSKHDFGGWYKHEGRHVLIKVIPERHVFKKFNCVALDVAVLNGGEDSRGMFWDGKVEDDDLIWFKIGSRKQAYQTTGKVFRERGWQNNYGQGWQHFLPLADFTEIPASLVKRVIASAPREEELEYEYSQGD